MRIEKYDLPWNDTRIKYMFISIFVHAVKKSESNEEEIAETIQSIETLRNLAMYLNKKGLFWNIDDIINIYHVFKNNIHSMFDYVPNKALTIPVNFIRAQELAVIKPLPEEAETIADPFWGWDQLTQGTVALKTVPGNHFTMLRKPHVMRLANQIRAFF